MRTRRTPREVLEDVGLAIAVASIIATAMSVVAVAQYSLQGPSLNARYGATLPTVLVTYYGSGILSGVVIGCMLPLWRTSWGRYLIGAAAFIPFYSAVFTVALGPQNIGLSEIFWGLLCAAVAGTVAIFGIHRHT